MLICLRHSPSVGSPNVFSSPSSKQQAPVKKSRHVVAGLGSALMDGKPPAALFFVLFFFLLVVPQRSSRWSGADSTNHQILLYSNPPGLAKMCVITLLDSSCPSESNKVFISGPTRLHDLGEHGLTCITSVYHQGGAVCWDG